MALETAPLSQGFGYGILIGLGAGFTLLMMLITRILKRYQKEIMTAEEFSTAGHSVKTSLIVCAVVSSWTWEATILNSTTQSYKNGIPGGYMYGAGACVQVILFGTLAIRAKKLAPEAHTFLELIKARYGKWAHWTFMYYGVATNILVSAMLLAGVCATLNFLTGINKIAALFLLPLGIVAYIIYGGIRAVFITDFVHTIIIVVILLVFAFTVFATSDLIGSPGALWEQLTELQTTNPSASHDGSWLTFKNKSAGFFLIINLCGNFAAVFLDSGYWQKSIASDPKTTLLAYTIGGLAWVAIPVLVSTTMGLSCRALENTPNFIFYPYGLTSDQVSEGLVLPAAAYTLLGKGGAAASVLLVFMAFTSAMSAEVISVSSIVTYDLYRSYINPKATGKQLMWVNYAGVIGFTAVMIGFSIGLIQSRVSLGFLYNFMGIIIAPAVVPCTLTLFWKKQNLIAVIAAPLITTVLALITWIVVAKGLFGAVTYDTLFEDYSMFSGNIVAFGLPFILCPVFTYIFGSQEFDFNTLRFLITRVDETEEIMKAEGELPQEITDEEKLQPVQSIATIGQNLAQSTKDKLYEEEQAILAKHAKISYILCPIFFLVLIILVPMPLYGTGYIFSKGGFTAWVVIWILWLFCSAFAVIVFPLVQGRHSIYTTCRGIYWDLTGQSHKLYEWQGQHPEELHVVQSQMSHAVHEQGGIDDKIRNIDVELSDKS